MKQINETFITTLGVISGFLLGFSLTTFGMSIVENKLLGFLSGMFLSFSIIGFTFIIIGNTKNFIIRRNEND